MTKSVAVSICDTLVLWTPSYLERLKEHCERNKGTTRRARNGEKSLLRGFETPPRSLGTNKQPHLLSCSQLISLFTAQIRRLLIIKYVPLGPYSQFEQSHVDKTTAQLAGPSLRIRLGDVSLLYKVLHSLYSEILLRRRCKTNVLFSILYSSFIASC